MANDSNRPILLTNSFVPAPFLDGAGDPQHVLFSGVSSAGRQASLAFASPMSVLSHSSATFAPNGYSEPRDARHDPEHRHSAGTWTVSRCTRAKSRRVYGFAWLSVSQAIATELSATNATQSRPSAVIRRISRRFTFAA